MAGGGKSGGDSYWPGFVDALTNVVIAMIFVVVVLAISLTFAAQMMGKKLAEQYISQYKQQQAARQPDPAASAQATAAAGAPGASPPGAEPRLQASTLQGVTRIAVAAPAQASAPARVAVKPTVNRLQLDYEATALELDPKAQDQLRAVVGQLGADRAQRRVRLVATGPDPQLSDNQRAAYVRLLAVRNLLIEQGFAPEHLQVQIDTQTASASPSVWVSFEN